MHVLVPILGMPVLALALAQLSTAHAAGLACVVIVVFGGMAAADFSRLCMRLRWIWLSLVLIYLLFTPGEYLNPQWLGVAVTYEGVLGASRQLLSLFAMLAWVSFLLHRYPAMSLVSGLYQCLAGCRLPATWLNPLIVRLYLILQHTHQLASPNRDWLALLHAPEHLMRLPQQNAVSLEIHALRFKDWACLLAWCVMIIALFMVD